MNNLYELLKDIREKPICNTNWIGNLRFFANETTKPFYYTLIAIPSKMEDGQFEKGEYVMKRILCSFGINSKENKTDFIYGADCVSAFSKNEDIKMSLPWENYGLLIEAKLNDDSFVEIFNSTNSGRKTKEHININIEYNENNILILDEDYYISIYFNGELKKENDSLNIFSNNNKLKVSIAFHKNKEKAIAEAKELFYSSEKVIEKSEKHWEDYLASCPIINFEDPIKYENKVANNTEIYTPNEILVRELWHWWCTLINVNSLEFNTWDTYMAPDKPHWKGTWSNDGPECLSLLAMTNQKELTKKCIVNYISVAISKDGVHSWYTHASGDGCYGITGDSGQFSHGVPNILHTVEFYIRQTNDLTILDCNAKDDMTVWDKIKKYMTEVFKVRDINNDNLIEWSNLWETGWDDKNCSFFEEKNLHEWIEAVTTLPQDKLKEFYEQNNRPITSVVEQVYVLWALKSMKNLALIKGDNHLKDFCENQFIKTKQAVRDLMWNEKEGFYFDIDVKNNCLSKSKSSDAFYFLYFEDDDKRIKKMKEHLENKDEFELFYIPTASRDSKGFKQDGYWNGGHWPREMFYVGLALNKCGLKDKAIEIIVRALMSEKGCVVAENMDSITGKRKTDSVKMAYTGLLNIALLECNDKVEWSI